MDTLTSGARKILEDARANFDHYLSATPKQSFPRIERQDTDGSYWYPENTVHADVEAFASAFTCSWRVLAIDENFRHYYNSKPAAFEELAHIVTPNNPDPRGLTSHARFWKFNTVVPIVDIDSAKELCRTLRNGFAHFNFRYINVSPREYFRQIDLPLPNFIPQPDVANHYRIFICDWNKGTRKKPNKFMEPASDTRIVETHFAHFRYHLFMFLARLFSEPGHQYEDILTLKKIS
jgi:hypothetical protein